MSKRLITGLVAAGALAAAALPATASAQTVPPEAEVVCESFSDSVVDGELDLRPLTRARVRLICPRKADEFDRECSNGKDAVFSQDLNLSPLTRVRMRVLCIQ